MHERLIFAFWTSTIPFKRAARHAHHDGWTLWLSTGVPAVRTRRSLRSRSNAPHESAGTGVAKAWWKSLHPLAWALLIAVFMLVCGLWR
jgi:hypothetical protein